MGGVLGNSQFHIPAMTATRMGRPLPGPGLERRRPRATGVLPATARVRSVPESAERVFAAMPAARRQTAAAWRRSRAPFHLESAEDRRPGPEDPARRGWGRARTERGTDSQR